MLLDADRAYQRVGQADRQEAAIKLAAMQQLLTGKTRLPGLIGDWEVLRLGDVFDVTAGGDFHPSQSSPYSNEAHPYPIYSSTISQEGLYRVLQHTVIMKQVPSR